ncbi:MAG: DUF1289 domain-containing protein [Ignavibacteriales bacterium]
MSGGKKKNSPCNGVCTIHKPTGLCMGCLRTMDEIASWPYLTDEEKSEVMQELRLRRLKYGNRLIE